MPAGAGRARVRRRGGSRWRRRPARRASPRAAHRARQLPLRVARGPGASGTPVSRERRERAPVRRVGRPAVGPCHRRRSCRLVSLRRSPKKSPPSASTPATDQMAAVVATAVPSASCAAAAPPPKRPEPEPGDDRADRRRPGPIGRLVDRPARLGADRRVQQTRAPARRRPRSRRASRRRAGSAPRAFSASLRIAASSIGFASSSTAGIGLPGSSTPAAAAANGQPLPHHDLGHRLVALAGLVE